MSNGHKYHCLVTSLASINLNLVVVAVFCLLNLGCSSQQAIENARNNGAEAGRKDGQVAGAAGMSVAISDAEDNAYNEAVSNFYESGDYHRAASFEVVALASTFILGFILQYLVFYVLRLIGILTDIDWIVLSAEAKENLDRLSERSSQSDTTQENSTLIHSNPNHGQEDH